MNMPVDHALPAAQGVAFKEWHGVCRALEAGDQSIILRKGGIDEAAGEFTPEHPAFWLYPTHVHEHQQGLRDEQANRESDLAMDPTVVHISTMAVVALIGRIERAEALSELEDLHVWTPETVEKRFHYRRPGLWVLGVRVYRRDTPWEIAMTPAQAGCKTWVDIDPPLETSGLAPVLARDVFAARIDRLRSILATGGST